MTTNTSISTRNYGIDFLRMLSMFMVVILHTLGHGGILTRLVPGTPAYQTAWLLEIAAYCAVNCYALISGYVGYQSNFKLSRLTTLWLQIVFYTLGLTLFFAITHPEYLTIQTWLNACFPIMNTQYWYLTSYFGMSVFIPILNLAIQQLERTYLRFLLITCFLFFIAIPTLMQRDTFSINGGFSVIWLCMLYLIGGYIKKYRITLSKKICLLLYGFSILLTWFYKMQDIPILIDYASPTILLAAVSLLLIFANITINNTILKKIISLLAPAALSVYIIHVNPLIWNYYIIDFAVPLLKFNTPLLITGVLIASFAIYLACSLFDLLRIFIFTKLNLRKHLSPIDKLLS